MTSVVVVPDADEVIDEYAASDKPTWYFRPFPRAETSRAEVVDVGAPRPGDGPTERPVDLDAFAVAKFNDDEADFPSVQAIRTGIPAEIVKINPHRQHPVLAFELAMVRLADQAYLVDPLCITPRRPV